MPGFDTAATIVSDVAKELGLVTAAIADPFASTDQNVVQLVAMLKPTGRELVRLHAWTHLIKEGGIATANGQASYALATDFGRIYDGTTWNRTQAAPIGVISPQQWQDAKGRVSSGVYKTFRIWGDMAHFDPTPTAIEVVKYEYVSRWWTGDATEAKQEAPLVAADVIRFDPNLFSRALKLRWRTEKGFDTTAALSDFSEALRLAKGQDGAASAVTIGGGRGMSSPNVPETGFGA